MTDQEIVTRRNACLFLIQKHIRESPEISPFLSSLYAHFLLRFRRLSAFSMGSFVDRMQNFCRERLLGGRWSRSPAREFVASVLTLSALDYGLQYDKALISPSLLSEMKGAVLSFFNDPRIVYSRTGLIKDTEHSVIALYSLLKLGCDKDEEPIRGLIQVITKRISGSPRRSNELYRIFLANVASDIKNEHAKLYEETCILLNRSRNEKVNPDELLFCEFARFLFWYRRDHSRTFLKDAVANMREFLSYAPFDCININSDGYIGNFSGSDSETLVPRAYIIVMYAFIETYFGWKRRIQQMEKEEQLKIDLDLNGHILQIQRAGCSEVAKIDRIQGRFLAKDNVRAVIVFAKEVSLQPKDVLVESDKVHYFVKEVLPYREDDTEIGKQAVCLISAPAHTTIDRSIHHVTMTDSALIAHSPNARSTLSKIQANDPKEELSRQIQELINSIQQEAIPESEDTVIDLSHAQTELKRKKPRLDMIKDSLGKAMKFLSEKAPKLLSTAKTILDLAQKLKGIGA